jgi:hypothetical protein
MTMNRLKIPVRSSGRPSEGRFAAGSRKIEREERPYPAVVA